MPKRVLFGITFAAVLLLLLHQLLLMLMPFGSALFLAGVLAMLLHPVTVKVRARLGDSHSGAAVVMMVLTFLTLVVPAVLIASLLVEEAGHAHESLERQLSGGDVKTMMESEIESAAQTLSSRFPALKNFDASVMTLKFRRYAVTWVEEHAKSFASDLVASGVAVGMMILALFFFFRDGERMVGVLRDLIPMEAEYKHRIAVRMADTLTAVVQSSLVVAVLQGLIGTVGYWLIGGLSVSVMLGFLTGVASLIPMAGSALVWVPAAGYLLFTDEIARGLGLVAWGVVCIGSVDNFVRPLIIGGRVQIPTFLLLFALVGGLQVYGFLGIILAPVVVGVLLALLAIYRDNLLTLDSSQVEVSQAAKRDGEDSATV